MYKDYVSNKVNKQKNNSREDKSINVDQYDTFQLTKSQNKLNQLNDIDMSIWGTPVELNKKEEENSESHCLNHSLKKKNSRSNEKFKRYK